VEIVATSDIDSKYDTSTKPHTDPLYSMLPGNVACVIS